jgi:hypothetical protein
MIPMFAVSLFVMSCSNESNEKEETRPENVKNVPMQRMEQLIALAACRGFDDKGTSLKRFAQSAEGIFLPVNASASDNNGSIRTRYAFDVIKIHDPVQRFVIQSEDFPYLNEICGEGEIEIFISRFSTFAYADETQSMDRLTDLFGDVAMIFRGELGTYWSMVNSGGDWGSEYSSHKRLSGNTLEKDFTPPVYSFYLREEKGKIMLGFRVTIYENGTINPSHVEPQGWVELNGDILSGENVYTMDKLADLPEISQQCTVVETGESYFMVKGDSGLKQVYFDEYTEFFKGSSPVTPGDIAAGDAIIVTFSKLYERYKPTIVIANKIVKK